eukprot:237994-Rhodomonas_salina.1
MQPSRINSKQFSCESAQLSSREEAAICICWCCMMSSVSGMLRLSGRPLTTSPYKSAAVRSSANDTVEGIPVILMSSTDCVWRTLALICSTVARVKGSVNIWLNVKVVSCLLGFGCGIPSSGAKAASSAFWCVWRVSLAIWLMHELKMWLSAPGLLP